MAHPEGPSRRPVYMDHHATTPVDPRVLEAMWPYFTEHFGNAASIDHRYGAEAGQAVQRAREQVASVINADPEEIIFTSGATEANNLAILGAIEQYAEHGNHIVTCVTEHKAVLDPCRYLEKQGCEVTYLPVDPLGMIDLDDLQAAITDRTVLISLMAANNEIGVLHPLAEIGAIAREQSVRFHTDATQAVGHIPVDVEEMNIDLLSMSAHKVYGPKGVGALYVRSLDPSVRVAEQMHGGGHERGMRSGTLNVPGIVGFGHALEIAKAEMPAASKRLLGLRKRLWAALQEGIEGIEMNGHSMKRLPHNLSVTLPGIQSDSLLVQLKHDVAISTGSACTTATVEPSHVILALGFGEERAHTSLRFGLGRFNTEADVDFVAECIGKAVKRLRRLTLI
ncbi:cysteine desulfurase [bacterium]|nr:cysteine desulfurase [bacterium]